MSVFFGYTLNVTPQGSNRLGVYSRLSSQFFLKPINETACSWDLGERDGWKIQLVGYFVDSAEHATYFACCFSESRDPVDKKGLDQILGPVLKGFEFGETLMKVSWATGGIDEWRSTFSKFLRNSESLNSRDFIELNSLSFTADGHGVAVVERNSLPFSDRALRLLHLVSLAGAYFVAMNRATDSLAEAAVNKTSSEMELRAWTKFLAKYYSSEPVRSTTVELVHFYAAIRDRLRIENHYRELTEQLRMHAELVSLDRKDRDTEIFNRFQKKLGRLSLVLGAFGVAFAAFAISPKQLNAVVAQWKQCYSLGWKVCSRDDVAESLSTLSNRPALNQKPKAQTAK